MRAAFEKIKAGLIEALAITKATTQPQTMEPFCPFIDKMKIKDTALYSQIQHMAVLEGISIWRERYPEDFTDLNACIGDPTVVRI